MQGSPLTGPAAAEALKTYMRLGAAGARFDQQKVAVAMRTRAGREKVSGALRAALSSLRKALAGSSAPTPQKTPENASQARKSASTDTGSAAKKKPRPRIEGAV